MPTRPAVLHGVTIPHIAPQDTLNLTLGHLVVTVTSPLPTGMSPDQQSIAMAVVSAMAGLGLKQALVCTGEKAVLSESPCPPVCLSVLCLSLCLVYQCVCVSELFSLVTVVAMSVRS